MGRFLGRAPFPETPDEDAWRSVQLPPFAGFLQKVSWDVPLG